MKYQWLANSRHAFVALAMAFLSVNVGCGVSSPDQQSSSTGSTNTVTIGGLVEHAAGDPIGGAQVTVLESGTSATTDKDGAFSLVTDTQGSSSTLAFLLEWGTVQLKSDPVAIDPNSGSLLVHFQVSNDNSTVVATADSPSAPSPTPDPGSGGSPQPTPAPGTKPTPGLKPTPGTKPTATPKPTGPFDANGNTTSFGIPSGLTGNAGRGKKTYLATCTSCHATLAGTHQNFAGMKAAMKQPPMNFDLPNSVIADLIAYTHFSKSRAAEVPAK